MVKKLFWVLDIHTGEIEFNLESDTPRSAALKAATRDKTDICLVEPGTGKVHFFSGSQIPLAEHEKTDFTTKRGIVTKPVVRKIGYKSMSTHFEINDMKHLAAILREQ